MRSLSVSVLASLATCLCLLAEAPGAAAQPDNPVPAPPSVVVGPNPGLVGLSGMSIARDGTGGIVFLEDVGGVRHVFVSRLTGGVFAPPQQLDTAFPGASSQPVIAAGNGGVLLVAFVNAGTLWVADSSSSSAAFAVPIDLSAGAGNPSIQISNFDKAYIAFTQSDGSASNVRAAYYDDGQWSLEASPLNAVPDDDAGTGQGAPSVATAGDGVATVVWGENGHIYSRRVWATAPSVVYEQADVPSLGGWTEVSSGEPAAGAGGDSSYVGVVFEETFTNGSQTQTRVLMNRLQGSVYDGVTAPDGLTTPGSGGAEDPKIAVGEYGAGLVTSSRTSSDEVWTGVLADDAAFDGAAQLDGGETNLSAPDPVPGTVGLGTFVVAWQHDEGVLGGPEIEARYYANGTGQFGPEEVVSSPAMGPTDAAMGIADGGDVNGDVAVAWVQGSAGSLEIVADLMYQSPGPPSAVKGSRYARSVDPVLSWNAADELWGPVRYAVFLDGNEIGTTTGTSFTVPAALSQGQHTWHVVATNPADLQSAAPTARVFVDSIPPVVSWSLSGRRRSSAKLRITVRYTDAPDGLARQDASGVATIVIHWGDRTSASHIGAGLHRAAHMYLKPGHYLVTVLVTDRAGNRTRVARVIAIKAPPKPKPKRKPTRR